MRLFYWKLSGQNWFDEKSDRTTINEVCRDKSLRILIHVLWGISEGICESAIAIHKPLFRGLMNPRQFII